MTLTDADVVNADGILRAAKMRGNDSFTIDVDFALALVAEVRAHRGIERKQ